MKPPLYVRPLTTAERATLQRGLRAKDAFTLRRCQALLHSAQGQRPSQIATALGCGTQTVRDALHAFAHEGLDCLRQKPTTPHAPHAAWPKDRDEDLRALLHQSPRTLGKPTSLWTLELAAEVCHEKGWTTHRLSRETLRRALEAPGRRLETCQALAGQPRPPVRAKKNCVTS